MYRLITLFLLSYKLYGFNSNDYKIPIITENLKQEVIINLAEHENTKSKNNFSILLVHGFLHNSSTFNSMIEEILPLVSKVFVIDMPCSGKSTCPQKRAKNKVSSITFNDNVNALNSVLNFINEKSLKLDAILGHSLGGLTIQALEEKLLKSNSNLKSKYGINSIILIQSIFPREIKWSFKKKALKTFLSTLKISNCGIISKPMNNEHTIELFYSEETNGEIKTPTIFDIKDCLSENFIENSISENSLKIALTLTYSIFGRPSIRENIFSNYNFITYSFANDTLIKPEETENLFRYLSGIKTNEKPSIVSEEKLNDTSYTIKNSSFSNIYIKTLIQVSGEYSSHNGLTMFPSFIKKTIIDLIK